MLDINNTFCIGSYKASIYGEASMICFSSGFYSFLTSQSELFVSSKILVHMLFVVQKIQ